MKQSLTFSGAQVYDRHSNFTRPRLPYVRLESPTSGPLQNFVRLLRSDESAKASLVLEVARWVAFSCRLLSRDELVAAVVTSNGLGAAHQQCASGESKKAVIDTAKLLDQCTGFLEVARDGSVTMPDTVLRTYILSPAISALNPCQEAKVHERIAMVCLRHLQCIHPETIFRPWLLTGHLLKGEIEPCRLRSYSTAFWHEHFRYAENHSRCLSYLLDKTVRSAVGYDADHIPQSVKSDRRVNYGLWLCCLYDLRSAGAIYLQMGAEIDYQHPCGETPLHIAAANACPNMLGLLLSKGAGARYRKKDMNKGPQFSPVSKHSEVAATLCIHGPEKVPPGLSCACGPGHLCQKELTPLHLAANNGHVEIVKLLLEADFNVNAVAAGSLDTPLHLAAKAGHEAIVRCLLHHGADPGERNAASETAWQVAVEERHTSVVKLLMQPNVRAKERDFPNTEHLGEVLGESSHVNLSDRLRSPKLEDEFMAHQLRSLTVQAPQQSLRQDPSSCEQNGDDGPEGGGYDGWCVVTKSDVQMEVE
jgi:Ankyrin repeats (3 copies)/Ankyrin repeat